MKTYLILAAIVLIAVCTILIFYFTQKTTELTGLEIAKSSTNFLTIMKRSDGKYDYSMKCTDDAGCIKDSESYIQSGTWVVLAYGGLYQVTGELQYSQKMNVEANDLINACNGNEDECMWILTQMIKAYKISNNPQYFNFAKSLGDRLLTNNEEKSAMMSGIEARELALLYELTNNQTYLNEANVRLEKSKAAWGDLSVDQYNEPIYSSGSFTLYRFACWTTLAEAEIARVSSDTKARSNVIDFLNLAKIESNYKTLDQLTALQPCVETLLSIYEQTGDVQYYNQAKTTMQYIITYRWDSSLSIAKKYNGDGAYLFNIYTGYDLKTVTDTGYMIYLLSKMPEEKFYILNWR